MRVSSEAGHGGGSRLPAWLWVFLGILVLRAYPLLAFASSPFLIPDDGDMAFYHQWAMRSLTSGLTDGQAFYGLPGYPFLLSLLYRCLGLNFLTISLLQFLLDAVTGVVIFSLVGRVVLSLREPMASGRGKQFLEALPYAAAMGWAIFQPSQAFSLILMPTSWTLCFYWVSLWLMVCWRGEIAPGRALGLGVATGLFSMVVATVLALVPLAAGTALFSTMNWSKRLAALPLLLLGVFIGSSPCWFYNRIIASEPVFLSAHSGLNMYVGNNPLANGYPRLPRELGATQAGMLHDSILVAEKSAGRPLTYAEVSDYWATKAREWIHSNRMAWAALVLKKVANFWNAFEYDDLSALTIFRENRILIPCVVFGTLAMFGLPGLLLALVSGGRAAHLTAWGVLSHMVVLLPVFITERYRLPAAPGLFVLSAYFLAWLFVYMKKRAWRRIAVGIVLLTASALLVFQPRDPALTRHDLYNSGRAALAAGQLELAEEKLLRAAEANPDNAEIQFSIGNLRLEQGDRYQAKLFYRKTLELDPGHDRAWNNLAVLALEDNHLDLALHFISQAIKLFPEDAKSHYIQARILQKFERWEEAKVAAARALEYEPNQTTFQKLLHELETREQEVP